MISLTINCSASIVVRTALGSSVYEEVLILDTSNKETAAFRTATLNLYIWEDKIC
jgi:hypothetical protein